MAGENVTTMLIQIQGSGTDATMYALIQATFFPALQDSDSSGYVSNPQYLNDGQTVDVSGSIANYGGSAITSIEIALGDNSSGKISLSVANKKSGSFSASVPLNMSSGTSRTQTFRPKVTVNWADGKSRSRTVTLHAYSVLRYRLELKPAMEFVRSDASGKQANDGTRILCRSLKLNANSQVKLSDITSATLTVSVRGGSTVRSVTLNQTQLASMLGSSGYTETTPSLIPGDYELGRDYDIALTVSDAYDQYTSVFTLTHAFAIVDFARASTGGFAVGMFSNAAENDPMFEVADSHRSIFYGPVEFRGEVSGVGIAGFTTVTLENSSSSNRTVSGTIPTIAGANIYICTGVLGWNSGGRAGYASPPTISGNTLSLSLAGNTTVLLGILGLR